MPVATVRVLSGKTPINSAAIAVQQDGDKFTVTGEAGAHLFGHCHPSHTVEILLRDDKTGKQSKFVGAIPKAADDGSFTIETKAVAQ